MSLVVSVSVRPQPPAALPLLMITLGGAVTGFAPLLARASELGPVGTAAWRMAFAALAVGPFLRRGTLAGADRGTLFLVGLAGVFFACDLGFFHWALALTSVAQATLIVNLAPLVALAAGFLLFGERLGAVKLGGLALATGGAVLMTVEAAEDSGALLGNALAMLGMLGYAFYLVVVKRARVGLEPAGVLFGSSVVAALVLFAAAVAGGETLLPGSLEGFGILVLMGVGAHALGQGLVATGIGRAPVGLASILLLSQPVVAGLAAWGFLGEALGPLALSGAGLVLGGMVLASRARG